MSKVLQQLQTAVIAGEADRARELAAQALEASVAPLTAIDEALNPGMQVVGDRFERGEYFIPDLVMSAEAMKAAMAVLEPELLARSQERKVAGRVVIGTVKGDIHEIGKSLVATMLTANGFDVYDLGVDVPAQRFVEQAQEIGADIVGLSALLTTTMINQEAVIEALAEAGIREWVKVIVGGAPVSADWAKEIGADGYAENANEAVSIAKQLVEGT